MYQSIIEKIVNESNKVSRKSVPKVKVQLAKKSAKILSNPKELLEEPIITKSEVIASVKEDINKSHKIPISPAKKKNKSRYPTKHVDFGDGVSWL
jgi:hypothetical protein